MRTCTNCGSKVPCGQGGYSDGHWVCCIHCVFNPLGCRCIHGEFGVEETRPDFGIDEGEPAEFEGDMF